MKRFKLESSSNLLLGTALPPAYRAWKTNQIFLRVSYRVFTGLDSLLQPGIHDAIDCLTRHLIFAFAPRELSLVQEKREGPGYL